MTLSAPERGNNGSVERETAQTGPEQSGIAVLGIASLKKPGERNGYLYEAARKPVLDAIEYGRYDDEEKSGNYTRWGNGELYLDSDGNSGEHGQLADWSGLPPGIGK
ncbi:hypothetical protein L5D93_07515 [Paenibacillus thiaminolyticus]|nr:hypothetical protein [Paenibacillus thiaminolyticus]